MAAAGLSVIMACGGAGDQEASPTASSSAAPTTSTAAPTTTAAATPTTAETRTLPPLPPDVEVTAADFKFIGLPATIPTGTRLTMFNSSEFEFHEMVIMKLDDDDTRSLDEIAELPHGELLGNTGRIIGIPLARPSEAQFATAAAFGNGRVTESGRYVVFCGIPVGGDPTEIERQVGLGPPVQIEGIPSHYQVGMVAEFSVED